MILFFYLQHLLGKLNMIILLFRKEAKKILQSPRRRKILDCTFAIYSYEHIKFLVILTEMASFFFFFGGGGHFLKLLSMTEKINLELIIMIVKAIFFTRLSTLAMLPTVYYTQSRFHTLLFIAERQAGKK